jgi:hypothetical protein
LFLWQPNSSDRAGKKKMVQLARVPIGGVPDTCMQVSIGDFDTCMHTWATLIYAIINFTATLTFHLSSGCNYI